MASNKLFKGIMTDAALITTAGNNKIEWSGGTTTDTCTIVLGDARPTYWVANIRNNAAQILTVTFNNYDGTNTFPLTSVTVAAAGASDACVSVPLTGLGIPGTITLTVSIAAAANGKFTLIDLYGYW